MSKCDTERCREEEAALEIELPYCFECDRLEEDCICEELEEELAEEQ